jgi:hypothetical protein
MADERFNDDAPVTDDEARADDAKTGAAIGGIGGAAVGAAAGSMMGPAGAVVGGVIGGVVGAAGSAAGVAAVHNPDEEEDGETEYVDEDPVYADERAAGTYGTSYDRTGYADTDVDMPGNDMPGIQTGGRAADGSPDTRGVSEKVADTFTGDRVDDKTGRRID